MLLSIHDVAVNRGVKSILHLAGRPGKLQNSAPFGGPDLKPMRLQPSGDGAEVIVGRAKLPSELFRREPSVIVGRTLVLLIVEQAGERRLLPRAALQDKQHTLQGQARWSCSQIKFRAGQRMRVSLQNGELRFIDRVGD